MHYLRSTVLLKVLVHMFKLFVTYFLSPSGVLLLLLVCKSEFAEIVPKRINSHVLYFLPLQHEYCPTSS